MLRLVVSHLVCSVTEVGVRGGGRGGGGTEVFYLRTLSVANIIERRLQTKVCGARWSDTDRVKPSYCQTTYPSTNLFIVNSTLSCLRSNPDLLGEKPATNRLSYDLA
jgi:hypothetical protein